MTSDSLAVHDAAFYREIHAGSKASAEVVTSFLSAVLGCRSVVDFGCGTGLWLRAFADLGVQDFMGVDGDHIDVDSLAIDGERFVARDLKKPVDLDRRFDLAICLEVAEHLPDESGGVLVDSLTRHSDRVLFSAGIPHQLGTGHISGRWPSAWVDAFGEKGYIPLDVVRPRVWNDSRVEYWYAQNALLFVTPTVLEENQALVLEARSTDPILDIVHPAHYLELKDEIRRLRNPGLTAVLRLVGRGIGRALGVSGR